MSTKACTRCNISKPLGEFRVNRGECRSCAAERERERRKLPDNQARAREWHLEWHKSHPEKNAEYVKGYRKNNPESVASSIKNWRKNNPEKVKAYDLVMRHKRRRGGDDNFTAAEWQEVKERYGNRCLDCGEIKPLTPDHVVPLSRGGANTIDNIQPLCGSCNSRKWAYTIDFRPAFNKIETFRFT